MGHLRIIQRGIPNAHDFSKHPLIEAVSSDAKKLRANLLAGPDHDPTERHGAHGVTPGELEQLLDASRALGTPVGFKAAFGFSASVAAAYRVDDLGGIQWSMLMVQVTPTPAEPAPMEVACLARKGGKTDEGGHLLWSGFARHIQPHLCPLSSLADVAVRELNLGGFDLPSMMLRDDPQ